MVPHRPASGRCFFVPLPNVLPCHVVIPGNTVFPRSAAVLLLIAYVLLSAISLGWFPFIHSDEVWLASLTREMAATRSLAATEPFFELTPRHPHAIKTLYHLLQLPFVAASFTPVAARLPSAVAGLAVVVLTWRVLRRLAVPQFWALTASTAAGLDAALLAAAHTARQEALLLAMMMLGLWLLTPGMNEAVSGSMWDNRTRRVTAAACVVAAGVFVHPNALLLALGLLPWLHSGREVLRSVLIVAAAGLLAVGASLLMDPDFVRNYLAFGDAVGVTSRPLERVFRFNRFLERLWNRTAGTYYLPPFRLQMLLVLPLAFGGLAAGGLTRRHKKAGDTGDEAAAGIPHGAGQAGAAARAAASLLLVTAGILLIGKNSPPSAVFVTPWLYLLLGLLAALTAPAVVAAGPGRVLRGLAVGAGVALVLLNGLTLRAELAHMRPHAQHSYRLLGQRLNAHIESAGLDTAPVLANLNLGFILQHHDLLAYRDFGALERGSSILPVLAERGVRLVLLPREELELILAERPVWNDVYGNPLRFVPELLDLLENHGTRHAVEPSWRYGMRLEGRREAEARYTIEVWELDLQAALEAMDAPQ